MLRRVMPLLLIVALTAIACGGSEPEASPKPPKKEEAGPTVSQGPFGAGSGIQRDDDCVQITRGEIAEIVMLDNVFAPECPVLVSDQTLRLRNLGVRDHSLTISENQDDATPFLLDLTIEGQETLETETPLSDFVEPGTYEFFCKFHSGMDGVVEVLEPVGA